MEFQTQNILGHEKNFVKLSKLIKQNKLPNSLIFQGSKGIGKTTSAYRIAQYIFEQNENPTKSYKFSNSDIYQKICNNSYTNLLVIEKQWLEDKKRFKNQIYKDDITSVKKFYLTKADKGQYRICIIDNIDDFSIDASNSLLKLVEEPPKNSLFIIINHNKSKLLKTIQSRSFVLNFSNLKFNEYSQLLKSNNYRFSDLSKLYELTAGDLQSSFDYVDNDFDTIDGHFRSLLLDSSKIKINTATHYVTFFNEKTTLENSDIFINYLLLKIKKTILELIRERKKSSIYKLIKSYYFLDKVYKNQKVYNLNFDHILIKFFNYLKNV
jgi:replication-associated recombination protein RarA